MIRIRQMKTSTYIKPISKELKQLIEMAIAYTKEHYGETQYIFVREEDPTKPMKYGTLQGKIWMTGHWRSCSDTRASRA